MVTATLPRVGMFWQRREERKHVEVCGGWMGLSLPELISPFPRMGLLPHLLPSRGSPAQSSSDHPPQESYPPAHEAVVEGQSNESEGSLLDEVWVEDANLRGLLGHSSGHRLPEAIGCAL